MAFIILRQVKFPAAPHVNNEKLDDSLWNLNLNCFSLVFFRCLGLLSSKMRFKV